MQVWQNRDNWERKGNEVFAKGHGLDNMETEMYTSCSLKSPFDFIREIRSLNVALTVTEISQMYNVSINTSK